MYSVEILYKDGFEYKTYFNKRTVYRISVCSFIIKVYNNHIDYAQSLILKVSNVRNLDRSIDIFIGDVLDELSKEPVQLKINWLGENNYNYLEDMPILKKYAITKEGTILLK